MTKSFPLFLIISYGIAVSLPPRTAYAAVSLPITAQSAVLLDHNSQQLFYSKQQHLKRAPASTTKVLTAIVAMDNLALNDIIRIPKFAESIEPSKAYLKEGEKYYVRDLLKLILVNSANDAAETLAHAAAGSRGAFSEKMNAKARAIGCLNSQFIRASGLPAANQYSTSYDLAVITRHAQNYPFIVEAMKIKTGAVLSVSGRKIFLRNHNKMLWRDKREVVGKTGWTRKAKHCFAGHIRVMNRTVSVAMMGSRSMWKDLKILVDYQFGKSLTSVKSNRKLWSREETRRIQTALKKRGFNPGSIDGKFGHGTVKAVTAFQKSQGLNADGVVTRETFNLLVQNAGAGPGTAAGNTKDAQIALAKAGYNPGTADGVWGPKSRNSLRAFQKAQGIEPDGVLGSFTWEKLQGYL